ncbi:DUF2513 domain-containing protein [Neisseria perflava]|uniref:DUF2513 domain-containing protein n=1 Tax=Neisseria perflava TaxID=33053 RepID=UPI00209EDF16|nr:DUF2513 domain-containing protein [Neisseria perflava]MCP1659335.1 hypothetical protein [Neisseria perflava]MCP1772860.1 hypothetical protein [Neisseria perflava]
MQRDWELIRAILARLEDEPEAAADVMPHTFEGYAADKVSYHIWLLMQSGLIVGICNGDYPRRNFQCYAVSLTWAGHEFLAAVKSDAAWRNIRKAAKERSLELSFEVVKTVAAALVGKVF